MKKLLKLIKGLLLLIRQPSLINQVLEYNDVFKSKVKSNFPELMRLPQISITNFFSEQQVTPYAFLDGGSLLTDLAFLRSLAAGIKDCNYFEIGSWRGESLANVAPFAKKCTSLNLSDAEMRSLGLSDEYINQHYYFSKEFSNIEVVRGNSLTYDFTKFGKSFDLVFVDGDHKYEAVKNDTARAFSVLKDENSIIVWHDYGRSPELPRYEVLAGILEGTPAHLRKHLYHVSNTLCAIFIRKDLPVIQNSGMSPLIYFDAQLKIVPTTKYQKQSQK